MTNDDGVDAPGIDVLTQTLEAIPDVDVKVIAPATDRSGTGATRSAGVLIGTITTTMSGHPAVGVEGYPADTVLYAQRSGALAHVDVVVSGVNWGENIGPTVGHSGTIGAARTAVSLGVPGLAVSQGNGDPPDFASGAALAAQWLEAHRSELVSGSAPRVVTNLNVPTCASGPRGLVTVPVASAPDDDDGPADCGAIDQLVDDDLDGFSSGYATLSTFDSDLRPLP